MTIDVSNTLLAAQRQVDGDSKKAAHAAAKMRPN